MFMRTASIRILGFAICLGSALVASAQDPSGIDFGIVPGGAYASYKVDSVNMASGNGVIHIPLFSLPQRGALSLSFSINANTSPWRPLVSCDSTGCTYSFTPSISTLVSSTNGFGPSITLDQFHEFGGNRDDFVANCYTAWDVQYCSHYVSYTGAVLDGDGAMHGLYTSATDTTHWRTTDGTLMQVATGPNVDWLGGDGTPTVLTDKSGNTYSYGSFLTTIRDRDGNMITYRPEPLPVDSSLDYVVDSVGRIVPSAQSTSTDGCPTLGASFQTIDSAAKWSVPGQGGNIDYKICFTLIQVRTGFFASGTTNCYPVGDGDTEECYADINQQVRVIQSVVLPDGTYYGFKYDAADPNDAKSIGFGTITGIVLPTSGTIDYKYSSSAACDAQGASTWIPSISSRTVSDVIGHKYVWTYSIGEPGSTGYTGSVETDPDGNDTVYRYDKYYGSRNLCAMHEIERKYFQGSSNGQGTLLRDVQTTYSTVTAPEVDGTSAMSDLPTKIVTAESDGTQTIQESSYSNQTFSAFARACPVDYHPCSGGNHLYVTPSVSSPLGEQTSLKVSDGNGTMYRSTSTTFLWQANQAYLTNNVLDKPSEIDVYDGSGNLSAKTTMSYDEASYVVSQTTLAGHATAVTRMNSGGADVTTRTYWNAYGMPSKTLDGNQVTNHQFTYDGTNNLFVISDADAEGNLTNYSPDLTTGRPNSVTDVNGQKTSFIYDNMGRVTDIQYPDGGEIQYDYHSGVTPPKTTVTRAIGGSSGPLVNTIAFDGLGRAVKGSLDSAPEGPIVIDKSYNFADAQLSVSNPYFSKSSPSGYTAYSYDALGRARYKCNPDNGTGTGACAPGTSYQQWVYRGLSVTFTDERLNSWVRTSDPLGRLTRVIEPNGATTHYTYDTLGNLTCAAQDGGSGGTFTSCAGVPAYWRPRTFSYDSLSRLLCASNPENSSASCPTSATAAYTAGTTGYSYDGNSNVLSKTDPRGVTANYRYDNLNRLLSTTYSGSVPGGSLSSCFQYGSSSTGNQIGRLVAQWTQSGSCSAAAPAYPGYQSLRQIGAYDATGRVTSEQQCAVGYCTSASVPSVPAQKNCTELTSSAGLQFCYNLIGNLLAYNSGVTPTAASNHPDTAMNFSQTFDAAGRLVTITGSLVDGTHPGTLFNALGYAPTGTLSNWQLGANLYTSRNYDSRLRVCSQLSAAGQTAAAAQCAQ